MTTEPAEWPKSNGEPTNKIGVKWEELYANCSVIFKHHPKSNLCDKEQTI